MVEWWVGENENAANSAGAWAELGKNISCGLDRLARILAVTTF